LEDERRGGVSSFNPDKAADPRDRLFGRVRGFFAFYQDIHKEARNVSQAISKLKKRKRGYR